MITTIDRLTYGYESGSNRLSTVRDATGNQEGFKQVNTSGADYGYDDFGNLISDKHKKISKIRYNHLNLPVEINFGSDKIEYLYTASGEKVQKKVTEKGVVTLTDYLGGFQYVKGKLSFFPTAEGFFNAEKSAYVYQYKDHLGNVRLSYSDANKNNAIESNKIIEETNYYPFGLAHKGYNQKNDALMKDYKYQFQGQEIQKELGLNIYFFRFRMSDSSIGRFLNIDPLSPTYSQNSPYAFAENNVTSGIDLEGLELSFNLQGDRATAQYGPRVTGGVNGNYTSQELRSLMAQRQVEYDRMFGKIMANDPRALPKSEIRLPANDLDYVRYNDPSFIQADWAGHGMEYAASGIGFTLASKGIMTGVKALMPKKSVWSYLPLERGRLIEIERGADTAMAGGFPVIDKIDDGVATSIKSMDLTGYQGKNAVFNKMKGYINDLIKFESATYDGVRVVAGKTYTSKALDFVVQTGKGSADQWAQINRAIQYGLDNDINVIITFMR